MLMAQARDDAVFNVKDFGALGDGRNDDTPAIRAAIKAARKYASRHRKEVATIYLPEGIYMVCPQPGQSKWQTAVFEITSSNLRFLGDGPDRTVLSFHHFGMTDPSTHWNTTDGGYFKIVRFNGFSFSRSPKNITFKGLRLTGNAEATGNSDVGGSYRDVCSRGGRLMTVNRQRPWPDGTRVNLAPASAKLPPEAGRDDYYYIVQRDQQYFQLSRQPGGPPIPLRDGPAGKNFRMFNGDGWDMQHKAVALNSSAWDNILFEDCRIDRWRGEIIHGGGEAPGTVTIRNCMFEQCNASTVSVPSLVMENSSVRHVYNGIENYARKPKHVLRVSGCTFTASPGRQYGETNAIVPLALPGSGGILIEDNRIGGFKTGVYLAESAPNATIRNNAFMDTGTPVRITRLGLYPNDPASFDDISIEGNSFHRSRDGGFVFYTQFGISNRNFIIRNNRLTTDSGQWAALGQDFCWTPPEQRSGYRIHDNDLSGGGYSMDSSSSVRPLWYNNIKPAGFTYANKKDVFRWQPGWDQFTFHDLAIDHYTLNNYTGYDGIAAVLDPEYLSKFQPGFTTEITCLTEKGFNLIPAEWNSWTEPLYINRDHSVKLAVGEDGRFRQLHPGEASPASPQQSGKAIPAP
jgi:hypothetical protein